MSQMLSQLGKEQTAEDNGTPAPDMPDISKLINQVTSSMLANDDLRKMIGGPNGKTHTPSSSLKPKVIVHKVPVTLAELFSGAARTINMRRQVYNLEHDRHDWEKTRIEFNITRGMRYSDRIMLEGVGDCLRGKEPGDLEVVLIPNNNEESIFIVTGEDNLLLNIDVPLENMFCYTAEIEHLNGQTYPLYYCSPKTVLNGKFKVVNLGLPREDGTFGDLLINAKIVFPTRQIESVTLVPQSHATEEDYLLTPCDPADLV